MKNAGWVLLVVAVAGMAGLYAWTRPAPAPPQPEPALVAALSKTPAPAAVDTAREFEFEVAKGRITGPPALTVDQGQRVILRVRSDAADELHLHGYELSAPLPAGEAVALTFIAARSGRFEIELHGAHLQLGALEVQPK